MLIVFSRHAIIKLEQRKINKQFVLETVRNPQLVRPSYGFREELYKKFAKNYMNVIVKRTRTKVIIVTMHWVAKISSKL